jgi:hypothetical protein
MPRTAASEWESQAWWESRPARLDSLLCLVRIETEHTTLAYSSLRPPPARLFPITARGLVSAILFLVSQVWQRRVVLLLSEGWSGGEPGDVGIGRLLWSRTARSLVVPATLLVDMSMTNLLSKASNVKKTQRRKDSRGFSRSMSHNPATRRIHRDQVLADAPEHAHDLDGDLYIEGPAGARLPALGRDRTPPSRLR